MYELSAHYLEATFVHKGKSLFTQLQKTNKQTQNTYFAIQLKLLIQDMTEDVTLSLDIFLHSSSFQTRTSALTLFFFGVHISLFLLAMDVFLALHHILHNWALTQKAVIV